MAALTGNDLIERFRRRYPDCDGTTAMAILNDAMEEACYHVPIVRATRDIAIVDDQAGYDLNADEVRVYSCDWLDSATTYSLLTATSEAELDIKTPGWRNAEGATMPSFWYLSNTTTKGQITLYPTPDVTPAAGYPKIRISVSKTVVFTTGLEVLPIAPMAVRAITDLMCYFYALEKDRQQASYWLGVSQESFPELTSRHFGRNVQKPMELPVTIKQSIGWRRW